MDSLNSTGAARLRRRLCLVAAASLYLYFHLFVPPFTPIWTGGDQVIFLDDAIRMLDGQVLYRDFAQMTFPGMGALYWLAFKGFGAQMWIPNLMLLLVGVALTWLVYFIAERIRLGRWALVPPLLFLTLVYRERLDATHHWFSTLAIMMAVAVVLEQRTFLRVAAAGVFCGIAACFTQSAGLLALMAFAIFVGWQGNRAAAPWSQILKKEALLLGCFAATLLLGVAYFVQAAGFDRFIDSTILFSLRYYPSLPGGNDWRGYLAGLPEFLHLQRLPALAGFVLIHALVPLVYVLFFFRYARDSREATSKPWDRLLLVALVGVFSFLSVVAAPTWARLYYVCLPALVFFVWILPSERPAGKFVLNTCYGGAILLIVAQPAAKQLHARYDLDLPAGRIAFLDRDTSDRYRWAASQTQPSDFFFGGQFPDFYFTLHLRNPGPVPFITPYEYTRPEQIRELLAGLEANHVKLVLWTPALDLPAASEGDHLSPLRTYLRSHYHMARHFADYDVWSRN